MLDIQYLQECINFEIKIGPKVCNFTYLLYISPSQTKNQFESFAENIEFYLETIVTKKPHIWLLFLVILTRK